MQNSSSEPNFFFFFLMFGMTPLSFEILPYFRGWLGKSAFDEFIEYFIHVLKSKRFFSCHITNNSLNFIFQKKSENFFI